MAHLQHNCDSCRQLIPAVNPRARCLVCPDYDLCANCFLGERFTQGHLVGHAIQVFKQSGGNGKQPILASRRFPSSPPSLPESELSLVPPRSSNAQPASTAFAGTAPTTQWQPWFHPDSSPTPAFITLMNDIFTYLDTSNVGNLVPETYSRFLDDLGYLPHENPWKSGLQENFALSKESMADKTLKNAYDLFSIDHILLQRMQPPHVDPTRLTSSFQRALGSAFRSSMMSGSCATSAGPMPAITRNGFVEIMRIELLCDPSKEWGNFSRMLKKYDLPRYRGWADLPRSVLPEMADETMLQRVAGVSAYARRKGEEQLAAAQAEAQMRAKGNQAAVDLISGTSRVEYHYYR